MSYEVLFPTKSTSLKDSMNVYERISEKSPFVSTNLSSNLSNLWEIYPNVTLAYGREDLSDLAQISKRISSDEYAKELIKTVAKDDKILDEISKMVDVRELAALLEWLTKVLKLNVYDIDIIYEIEENVPQFVGIFIKDCDWEEWGIISKTVKSELLKEGFKDLARRVVIVCPEALETQKI